MNTREKIRRNYELARSDLRKTQAITHLALKNRNRELANSYRHLYEVIVRSIKAEESRQILVELHCSPESVTLAQHEVYHKETDNLKNSLVEFFILLKTFLNSVGAFLSKSELGSTRNLRFRSFHSLLDSTSQADLKKPAVRLLRAFKDTIEGALEFRDKYLEHAKVSYGLYIQSLENLGSLLVATADSASSTGDTSIHAMAKIAEFDKSTILKVNSLGNRSVTKEWNYYYHVRRPVKFPGTSIYQNIGNGLALPGDVLYEVFDETEVHFLEYGIHTHSFSCPELSQLDRQIFEPRHQLDDAKGLYLETKQTSFPSPNYLQIFKETSVFLVELLNCIDKIEAS